MRGARIEDILKFISRNSEYVASYQSVLLVCGTNNVETDSEESIVHQLRELCHFILSLNPSCVVIISSLIPRPSIDHFYGPKIVNINAKLKQQVTTWDGQTFVIPSYKLFVLSGKVEMKYYCSDGVHFNELGSKRIKQYISQMFVKFSHKPATLTFGSTQSYSRREWSLLVL